MLADDSEMILERMQESLKVYKGLNIIGIAKNGTDALKIMRRMKPDLAIIDLEMPQLNGFDVLKEIRKEDSEVKIIMLTFYSSDHYHQKAIQLGADYFFSKVDEFDKVSFVVAGMILDESKESFKYNNQIN